LLSPLEVVAAWLFNVIRIVTLMLRVVATSPVRGLFVAHGVTGALVAAQVLLGNYWSLW